MIVQLKKKKVMILYIYISFLFDNNIFTKKRILLICVLYGNKVKNVKLFYKNIYF